MAGRGAFFKQEITMIHSRVTTKQGDEFAPISPALKADLGLTERQIMLQRAEAARMREAKRARALIDAADRHADIERLSRQPLRRAALALAGALLALSPLIAGVLIALAMAEMWP